MKDIQFIHERTECSFSYELDNNIRRNLSVLISSGDDPAHLSICDWPTDPEDPEKPLQETKISIREIELLKKLLNDPHSTKILDNIS